MTTKCPLSYWTLCLCIGVSFAIPYEEFAKTDPHYGIDFSFPVFNSIFLPGSFKPKSTGYRNAGATGATGATGYGNPVDNTGYGKTGNRDSQGYGDSKVGYDDSQGYDNTKSGYGDGKSGYNDGKSGYGDSQGYGNTKSGYDDSKSGYIDNKSGYDDSQGYGNTKSGYDDAKSGHDAGKSGYGNSQGYGNTKSGYDDGKSGYSDDKSGYDNSQGYGNTKSGYDDGKSGHDAGKSGYGDGQGYGNTKSGYDDGKSGHDVGQSGYGNDQGYGNTKSEYDVGQSGNGNNQGYGNTKSGYDDGNNSGYGDSRSGYDSNEGYGNTKTGSDDGKSGYDGYGTSVGAPSSSNDGFSFGKFIQAAKCETEMYFNFNDPTKPMKEYKDRIWAGSVGQVSVYDGAANFDGNGHMEMPYFNQNDLRPAYFMSIVVWPKGDGGVECIFSNSLQTRYATHTLAMEGDRAVLTIMERPMGKTGYGTANNNPIQLSVRVNRNGYTRINIEQDDKTLSMSAGSDFQKVDCRLPAISHEPMYIGAGASSLTTMAPFKGAIDEFIFDKCPVNTER